MAFSPDYTVTEDHAVRGSTRWPGRPIAKVRFIVAHDTGNPGASARSHARWYRNDPNPPLNTVASAHLFVDDDDIIETIPAFQHPEQALHVLRNRPKDNELYGVDANSAAIGVEYCFGGTIDADHAYDRFVWLIAYLCDFHGLDPSRDVVGHQILDPLRKTDPGQALRRSGRSYEQLLADVVEKYIACGGNQNAIGTRRQTLGTNVVTTVRLRVREAPNTRAKEVRRLDAGTRLVIKGLVKGERVSGNDDWCEIDDRQYCWSGGVQP